MQYRLFWQRRYLIKYWLMDNATEKMHFKFDVSTFRLLGRELITDRITALFELVKNCYDANAQNVEIRFEQVGKISPNSIITIKDDGIGMGYSDLKNKWMVIGTSSKRRKRVSPPPYSRVVAGKKGVGRFAVDKLGGCLVLKTKIEGEDKWHCLKTDWTQYSAEEDKQLAINFESGEKKLFTDIDNLYWTELTANVSDHGTILEITSLNDVWMDKDIERAYKELSKIVRPTLDIKYPFNVYLCAPEYKEYVDKKKVESFVLSKATLHYELGYRYDEVSNKYIQQVLREKNGVISIVEEDVKVFGPIGLSIYYYDQNAKKQFKQTDANIDGVKIYRDGIIATPFAEYNSDRNAQKDLFGIDKRRYSGFFEKLSTRDLVGWLDITDKLNPDIKDSTNRQDFVDNKEWAALKVFVINQIHQIEEFLKDTKSQKKKENLAKLEKADSDINDIKVKIDNIKSKSFFASSEAENELADIASRLNSLKETVSASTSDFKQLEEEKKEQENIMFSLVSLQTYAGQISHIVRTSLGQIERSAEFVAKWVPLHEKVDKTVKHASKIAREMKNLSTAMDFMLSYAKDDSTFSNFSVKEALDDLFTRRYAFTFDENNIDASFCIDEDVDLLYNQKAFQDMFGNLIDNSVKALRNTSGGQIKCTVVHEQKQLVIMFSDNGSGVSEEIRDRIFDLFFTTTADYGGAGLGLYIVKTRLDAIHGSISLVNSELGTGATFKITIPFNKM